MIAGPLIGEEGILHAELDLQDAVSLKLAHDIVGTYNRFDVFQLTVNSTRHTPVTIIGQNTTATPPSQPRVDRMYHGPTASTPHVPNGDAKPMPTSGHMKSPPA